MSRDLRPYPLEKLCEPGSLVVTMGDGQWDALLAAAYAEGWILLELDDDEKPVRAFRKAE